MPAFRCSRCSTNWPFISDYQPCPECGEKTDSIGNAESIDEAEAKSRKLHADFDRWYDEREGKQLAEELERVTKGSE